MTARPDLRQRQGEKRPEWLARVRAVQLAEHPPQPSKPRRWRKLTAPDTRTADRIDGYDRDNLGESHD